MNNVYNIKEVHQIIIIFFKMNHFSLENNLYSSKIDEMIESSLEKDSFFDDNEIIQKNLFVPNSEEILYSKLIEKIPLLHKSHKKDKLEEKILYLYQDFMFYEKVMFCIFI